MIRRLLIRLLWAVVTVFGVSVLVFLLASSLGDPVIVKAGPRANKETKDRIRHEMGLDRPLYVQYGDYIRHAVQLDLGKSYVTEENVAEAIAVRFPTTLALALCGVAFWLLVGVPLGVLTAKFRDKPIDRVVLVLAMVSVSLPTFWLGRLLQFYVSYKTGALPVAGFVTWEHLILPATTLGIVGAGFYARLIHSNMVEVMNQDYIRAARAKGLSETTVLFKHALRNAMLPVLTIVGADIAGLLGGVVFTESIFALPGLGALALSAVLQLDVPMIMGTVLFAAVLVVLANLAVDFAYQLVDPRVKAGA